MNISFSLPVFGLRLPAGIAVFEPVSAVMVFSGEDLATAFVRVAGGAPSVVELASLESVRVYLDAAKGSGAQFMFWNPTQMSSAGAQAVPIAEALEQLP